MCFVNGEEVFPLAIAQDHKRAFEGDKGPNTGGMGAICPNPFVDETVLKDFEENISKNTLRGIQEEGFDYKGIIFFGLMITKKGTYLLEYNVRMGDPETQSVLSLMESDLFELIESALNEKLSETKIKWKDFFRNRISPRWSSKKNISASISR